MTIETYDQEFNVPSETTVTEKKDSLMDNPIDILFVAGFGRSGSTVLAQVLGQVDGLVSAGEVRHLWSRGILENQLCGCGSAFNDCSFWQAVTQDQLGLTVDDVHDRVYPLQREVDGIPQIPRLFWKRLRSAADQRNIDDYVSVLGDLLRAIRDVSGSSLVVDASKTAMHGLLLTMIPGARVHVLHLVRDPRAVAFSWRRKRNRPEVTTARTLMPRYSLLKSSIWWAGSNAFSERLAQHAASYHRTRYEDFISNPLDTTQAALKAAGVEPGLLDFISESEVDLRPQHTVAGNPSRFSTGPVKLRIDEEWKQSMSGSARGLVSCLTGRMLSRYGYR